MHIGLSLLYFPLFKNIDTNCINYVLDQKEREREREIVQNKYKERRVIS